MSQVLSRVWDGVKRHKKKVIALGTFAALGVGGYYYAKRMLLDGMRQVEELGREMQEQMIQGQQREGEKARVRGECIRMVSTFIPPLRSAIKKLTDPKPVTERLKAVRMKRKGSKELTPEEEEEMQKLWAELKVVSLSRLIAAAYAVALLNGLLRVQLHVLGRNAFEESAEHRKAVTRAAMENNNNTGGKELQDVSEELEEFEPSKITKKVRERFLFSGSDFLVNKGEGLQELVRHVRESISKATKAWMMGTDDKVSADQVDEMLGAIRREVECADRDGDASFGTDGLFLSEATRKWLVNCLVPKNEEETSGPHPELDDVQNELLKEMIDETLDMVESPLFALAMQESFDRQFDVIRQLVGTRVFLDSSEQLPLTKVIVQLKGLSDVVLRETSASDGSDSPVSASGSVAKTYFEQSVSNLPGLDELCTAIFDQGTTSSDNAMLDALGLDGLGLSDAEVKSMLSMLGSLTGGGDMTKDGASLASLLSLAGAGGSAPSFPGGPGELSEQELMQMLQSVTQQAEGSPTQLFTQ